MLATALARFPRLTLQPSATPLDVLPRLSAELGRSVYCKRDDTTSLALGGNKVRKLEYLVAEALAAGADTLVTAGAIQSNHVRQTAAVAAQQGWTASPCWKTPLAQRISAISTAAIACCWSCLALRSGRSQPSMIRSTSWKPRPSACASRGARHV
jgi:1-aminocyclopropane-1-carboxylate deaminase/D-cysteine desulfhydrase-like pyridoxal-dependent ACC family enzyme